MRKLKQFLLVCCLIGVVSLQACEAYPASSPLRWSPPSVTLNDTCGGVDGDGVWEVGIEGYTRNLGVDSGLDCVVQFPDTPITEFVTMTGGRNWIVGAGHSAITNQGGHIDLSAKPNRKCVTGQISGCYGNVPYNPNDPNTSPVAGNEGALRIADFSGTFHMEGIVIDAGFLGTCGDDPACTFNNPAGWRDAIRFSTTKAGSVFQLQNSIIRKVYGIYNYAGASDSNPSVVNSAHGDVVQTWAGPTQMRVDRFSFQTGYQGFYLAPRDYWSSGTFSQPWFIGSRIDGTMSEQDGYTLFALSDQGGDTDPSWLSLTTGNEGVWGVANQDGCPEDASDDDFTAAGVQCVTAENASSRPYLYAPTAGVDYVSPGYGWTP